MQLSQLSRYILSLRPIYLLGEYVGSLILFHLPENANVRLRQDGTFSKKFDLPVIYLRHGATGELLPVGYEYCNLWTVSAEVGCCGGYFTDLLFEVELNMKFVTILQYKNSTA